MNFTFNNHLKYYINNRLYGWRENPYEKYTVTVDKIDKDHYRKSNWLNEQLRTADTIYKELGKDLIVMFSGGTDSEIVIRSFLKIGIKPSCCFIKFKNDYNLDDLKEAKKVTKKLGLKLQIIEFDIIDFYKSGQAFEFSKTIQCRQIAYLCIYFNVLKLNCPAVMGGEMLLRRYVSPTESKWYYTIRENEDASAMRFSIKYNLPLINEWFSYTPEMIAYHLENPKINKLITERFNYKLSSVTTKNEILKEYMPEIFDKVKTHGYEKLMGFNGETYETLYKSHIKRLENSLDGIFIDDLVIQLGLKNERNKIKQRS